MTSKHYASKHLILGIAVFTWVLTSLSTYAQTLTETFEGFTLTPNSAYSSTVNAPFSNTQASFDHQWNNAFDFWSGGFTYTNDYDSITGNFSNLHGVRAYKGFNNSSIYVVGQDQATIRLTAPQSTVNGFYVTNTTYAYKAMAQGDAFARKFGDTTGTGSGTTIAQGSYPDYFKLVVKAYQNGLLKNDSVVVMLADYTFTNNAQDFILSTWQYVNTTSLGAVDSIRFLMRSSDVGDFGINTPLFFGLDNFETAAPPATGIAAQSSAPDWQVYPNPFGGRLLLTTATTACSVLMRDVTGRLVYQTEVTGSVQLDVSTLPAGMYLLELNDGSHKLTKRLLKN